MDKPGRRRLVLGVSALDLLPEGAEVDDVAHAKLSGNRCEALACSAGLYWNDYAHTVTLDHPNQSIWAWCYVVIDKKSDEID